MHSSNHIGQYRKNSINSHAQNTTAWKPNAF